MSRQVFLTDLADFPARGRGVYNVEGTPVLVVRVKDGFCAVVNKCPHMGFPLSNARIEDNTITCPFHNSQFDICSGENRDWVRGLAGAPLPGWVRGLFVMGRKPAPIRSYRIVVLDGKLYAEP
jgi:nitrite reductase/ring-hydroxylating ferredoxin subunit